jgi:hypothetical protein
MASNFKIGSYKTRDGFGLKLDGDFDATSAFELIYAVKTLPEINERIYICTDGLKLIHPFGIDVLRSFIHPLNGESTRIVFKGNNASKLKV